MIQKEITTEYGNFTIIIHSASSVAIRNENLTVNKIPYNVHTCYDVKDMLFTENYRFVSRRDSYSKEPTHDQKERVCDVMKGAAFNYIFSYPELLVEAQKLYITGKLSSLERERDELLKKLSEKQTEITLYKEVNREVLES